MSRREDHNPVRPAPLERGAGSKLTRQTFEVDGLDCAEEVALLKRELAGRPGILDLDFDVINARMAVQFDSAITSADEIVHRSAAAGLAARPFVPNEEAPSAVTWRQYLRLVLTIAAGALLLCGLASDVITRGSLWSALGHGAEKSAGGVPWISKLFYLASILCGSRFVVPKAWTALRRLHPDMNLLMSVAVIGAIILDEWFEAAVVTFLFSVALLLEHWSMGRARRAISALISVAPQVAHCKSASCDHLHDKPLRDVSVGTIVVVRPGERIPLDGVVINGHSEVDQAPITGESVPVAKEPGDEVFAGTINQLGVLEVEVTKAADASMLARILHMVSEAQSRRAPSEQWVERFAHYYTPAMMALGLLIAVVPPLVAGASWGTWAYNGLVVLVIACPCALVISTPVSVVSALTSAAHNGVLIKGGRYLEAAGSLECVALDKTGTLTRGAPVVHEVVPLAEQSPADILRYAASLERHSNHPLARAIVRRANEQKLELFETSADRALTGLGVEAAIAGEEWWIGSIRLVKDRGLMTRPVEEAASRLEDAGRTVVAVGSQTEVVGLIALADELRIGAREAVDAMRRAGVKHIAMLTGDNRRTAERIASQSGVDHCSAELLPEGKVREIERLQRQFDGTAMVGDGINDAPALAAATVGIAMGAIGSDAAIETADIALMSDDLGKVPWLIKHARRTVSIIKQNITFALGLKLLFVALTLAGMASLWLAIAADTGASLLVIFNGLRLLRRA